MRYFIQNSTYYFRRDLMCTAISYCGKKHYFGRNLDLEYTYDETITITPRSYPFSFSNGEMISNHHAMIGMATVVNHYPLYYEATNEAGLSIAALNFPGNAFYGSYIPGMINLCPFEFIPYMLTHYSRVKELKTELNHFNIVDVPFNKEYNNTPLHWIISDNHESITVEPLKDGMIIYDNPVGVLTNNPPFDYHMYNLTNYMNLTSEEPTNRFSSSINLTPYSRGMGGIGLPGDLSSSSRFVRAAFNKLNSAKQETEDADISQFFHILGSVAQQSGCVKVDNKLEKTIYTSCCDTQSGIYYYKTYENSQITAVNMFHENLNSNQLISFSLIKTQLIRYEN